MLPIFRSIFAADVDQSLEAELAPVGRVSGRGEIEVRQPQSGGGEVEVELKGIGDGEVEIYINGARWRAILARFGKVDQTFSAASGARIPPLKDGDLIDIRQSGEIILRGTLRLD